VAAPPPGPAHRGRLSAAGTARAVAAGELSAEAAVDGALRRLAEHADLCAFTSVRAAAARAEARALDARLARGEPAPRWAGVPFAVEGAGDAAEVAALRAAGAVPVGRTAVPPPGGYQTRSRTDHGPTRNPHRPDLSPGGSSAGSAAAVAAGIVPVATGSDGAGSTRIPAAWCGITGGKPTTALVRRRLGPGRDRSGLAVPGPLVADPADLAGWAEIVLGPLPAAPPPRTAVWSADLGFAAAEVDAEVVAVARAAALRLGVPLVDVPVRLRDPAAARAAVRGGDPRLRGLNDAALAAVFARRPAPHPDDARAAARPRRSGGAHERRPDLGVQPVRPPRGERAGRVDGERGAGRPAGGGAAALRYRGAGDRQRCEIQCGVDRDIREGPWREP
jgi:hypothetical protein